MISQPRIVKFPANTYIELDDPLTGKRRLVFVASTGTEYLDYLDANDPATPLDILDVLNPVSWGDCRSMADELMLRGDWDGYQLMSNFLLALCDTPAGGDALMLNRAVHWSLQTIQFNADRASLAAVQLTQDARSRQAALSAKAAELEAVGAL